ncbi:MAG: tol-pal system protein YbgF [Syntrophales bacterium]|nr:tol-pal system protein YbgF [Syntrophales bacterium]
MKNLVILFLALAFICAGCATQEELRRAEARLGTEIAALQKLVEEDSDALRKNSDALRSSGKIQADIGADVANLRDSVQRLRGTTERLDVKVSTLESSKVEDPRSSLKDISNRLTRLENDLGIGKTEGGGGGEGKAAGSGSAEESEPAAGREESYANAYAIFQSGRYDTAKEEFRKFLKAFPNSEYSDNAQFWIGECYYFQEKYEEAIIEYESVMQNYPKGNKVPNALLKQAFSFLKLGDKASAKLLLQGVIKDYPNTTPASVARKKLIDIK